MKNITHTISSLDSRKPEAVELLELAFRQSVPIVAFLGQQSGWPPSTPDPVVRLALDKAARQGNSWKALLAREPLEATFYEWLSERFQRRAPSTALDAICDTSCQTASNIDP